MDEEDEYELLTCWPPAPPVSSSLPPSTCNISPGGSDSVLTNVKDAKTQCTSHVRASSTSAEQMEADWIAPAKRHRLTGSDPAGVADSDSLSDLTVKDEGSRCGDDETDQLASVALARWWRGTSLRTAKVRASLPKSQNPHTLLAAVQRLDVAQDFLRSRVKYLENKLALGNPTAQLHAALGTFYEKILELPKAFHHLQKAVELQPKEKEHAWHLQRVLRQLQVQAAQTVARHLVVSTRTLIAMKTSMPVEVRIAESLSYTEFLMRYALTSTPVVITGLGDVITPQRWTLDHIRDIAGECQVTTRRLVEGSAEWARLEEGPTMAVSDFLRAIEHQEEGQELLYLFDWSLPQHCPKLAEELTIPKYFSGDFLQLTAPRSLYRESWPSLFVAPKDLHSELHVDAFGSNFWMALLSGQKRWIFFSQEDAPYLYPRYHDSFDPVFDVDVSRPDFVKYPLAQLAQPREVILKEGELLFVPAGCPHRVENLTNSVAISANYVDTSNISLVRRELALQALVDSRAEDLLQQFNKLRAFSGTDISSAHLPWSAFKRHRWQTDDL